MAHTSPGSPRATQEAAPLVDVAELIAALQAAGAARFNLRQLVRHMWLRYGLAVALILALSVVSYAVVINLNLLNETSVHLLQASARQLTLTESIGRAALRLTLPLENGERVAAQSRLRQMIEDSTAQYRILRDGAIDGSQTPAAQAIFGQAPYRLNQRLPALLDLALQLAGEVEFAGNEAVTADAARLSLAVDDLVPALQALVKVYEEGGVGKTYDIIETETYVTLGILVILALEVLLIFRPMIGRVRQTALLLQRQALLSQNTLATTQAFVVGLDQRGRIIVFNRYSEQKTGWPQSGLIGTPFAERFLPAAERARFAALCADLLNARRDAEYEAPCATQSGESLSVRWHLTAVRDPANDQPLLLLATGVDLTDIRAATQRLAMALDETRALSERLREEVAHAAQLQRSLLPPPEVHLPGMRGMAMLTTCTEVGGDYYDYYSVDERYAVVVIADASGHGVAAGSLVSSAKIAVRQMAERGETDPARLLGFINRALLASTHESMFMTMGCLCLDGATGLLSYASAGHVFPYCHTQAGGWQPLEAYGVPLGRVADAEYAAVTLSLAVGDRVFLYTDGLVEERSPAGEPFGFDRLEQCLADYAAMSCDEAAHWLHHVLEQYRGLPTLSDDATWLMLEHGQRQAGHDGSAGRDLVRLTDAAYQRGDYPPDDSVSRQAVVFLPREPFTDLWPQLCRDGIRRVLPEDAAAVQALGLPKLLAQTHSAPAEDLYRLMGKSVAQRQFALSHSDEKAFIGMEVAGLLEAHPHVSQEHGETALLVVDELLENALYGAPRDGANQPLYAKATPRQVAGREELRLDVALNDQWLGVMVTDGWGTLTPAVLLRRLALNHQQRGLRAGVGGAGLFLTWQLSDYCQVRVFPQRRTQFTVLWRLARAPDPESAPAFQFLYHTEADESCRLEEDPEWLSFS